MADNLKSLTEARTEALSALNTAKQKYTDTLQSAQGKFGSEYTSIQSQAQQILTTDLKQARDNFDNIDQAVRSASVQTFPVSSIPTTNPSQTAIASLEKMTNSQILGETANFGNPLSGLTTSVQSAVDNAKNLVNNGVSKLKSLLPGGGKGAQGGQGTGFVPAGAIPNAAPTAKVTFKDASGATKFADTRVKLRVPNEYLTYKTMGPGFELDNIGGIVFPYTPTITYEHKADYQTVSPTHSNFPINFYHRSSISNISISGRFSVQNETDAAIYLSVVALLRALTKMRSNGEINSGSPPPVCRLDAHGTDMLLDIPVALSSFRVELPDNVDYFTYGKSLASDDITSVPVLSTISLTLIPMYSRNEMQKFKVSEFVNYNTSLKGFI